MTVETLNTDVSDQLRELSNAIPSIGPWAGGKFA